VGTWPTAPRHLVDRASLLRDARFDWVLVIAYPGGMAGRHGAPDTRPATPAAAMVPPKPARTSKRDEAAHRSGSGRPNRVVSRAAARRDHFDASPTVQSGGQSRRVHRKRKSQRAVERADLVDTLHNDSVDWLHNETQAALARRPPARYTRPPDPPHTAGRSHPRPRCRQAHSANLRGHAPGRDRFLIPSPPSA